MAQVEARGPRLDLKSGANSDNAWLATEGCSRAGEGQVSVSSARYRSTIAGLGAEVGLGKASAAAIVAIATLGGPEIGQRRVPPSPLGGSLVDVVFAFLDIILFIVAFLGLELHMHLQDLQKHLPMSFLLTH